MQVKTKILYKANNLKVQHEKLDFCFFLHFQYSMIVKTCMTQTICATDAIVFNNKGVDGVICKDVKLNCSSFT